MRLNIKTLCAVSIFLAAALCAFDVPAAEAPKTLARVGGTAITEKDVYYRSETERAYGDESMTEAGALVSLINDAIELTAAKKRGAAPTEEEISSFSKYVDENTKAPEILDRVKKAFGSDSESYERLYLAPKIVNIKLHRFYATDRDIHSGERALIEKAHALAAGGKTMEDAAKESGLKSEEFYFEDKEVTVGSELQKYYPQGGEAVSDPLVAVLEKMKPGEVFGNILEDDYAYRVIKLVKVKGEKYLVEAVTVEKRGYKDLLMDDVSDTKVEILDPALRKAVRSKYPGLWWLKDRHK